MTREHLAIVVAGAANARNIASLVQHTSVCVAWRYLLGERGGYLKHLVSRVGCTHENEMNVVRDSV